MRQSQFFFRHLDQVRRENHATGMAGPMLRIQARIIFRKEWIARVSEDGFDEIQIAYQTSRCEEPNLHRLLQSNTRHFRTDGGPQ